jgi:hypothetical protein
VIARTFQNRSKKNVNGHTPAPFPFSGTISVPFPFISVRHHFRGTISVQFRLSGKDDLKEAHA